MKFIDIYKLITKLLFLICPLILFSQNPYITVWQTDIENVTSNPYVSGDNEVIVPAVGQFSYTWIEVDNPDSVGSGTGEDETLISFPTPGTYELSITPTGENPFHRVNFGDLSVDKVKLLEVSQWGDVEWSTFKKAYKDAVNLKVTATDTPDLSQVTDMSEAFRHIRYLEINAIENWDVSQVIDMSKMFYFSQFFDPPSLENWNVSNVEDMSYLFSTTKFNQPVENWDVSKVTNMEAAFVGTPFNQTIIDWDVSSVTNMSGMFARSSFNHPISKWRVSQVENMSGMFEGSPFNQSLNEWDVSNVTNMSIMFMDNYVFNQPLDQWDVSQVEDMSGMFHIFGSPLARNEVTHSENDEYDSDFNQPLNSWDVSNVVHMEEMFSGATSFDQPLDEWSLESLEEAWFMFSESGMSCENASISLKGWAENPNTNPDVMATNINVQYSPDIQEAIDFLIEDLNWELTGVSLGECSLGLEDHQIAQFSFYPNPAEGIINFETTQSLKGVTIYNLIGQEVLFVEHPANRLDVSQLNTGMYMMTVKFENGQKQTLKLVKE